MSFILAFDFPKRLSTERRKLNRMLHRIGAKKLQDSFWKHERLEELIEVARFIVASGGRASILEEKLVFDSN